MALTMVILSVSILCSRINHVLDKHLINRDRLTSQGSKFNLDQPFTYYVAELFHAHTIPARCQDRLASQQEQGLSSDNPVGLGVDTNITVHNFKKEFSKRKRTAKKVESCFPIKPFQMEICVPFTVWHHLHQFQAFHSHHIFTRMTVS